ncbi:hypothetical protein HZ992_15080 [Rhizobacter sp. AJA081-3]|uniref:hypothetical protein n=1 Tax=Rhizobacter sp. AJA081-3 TaxID=2753607 RepID=UPI001ADFD471|nr:hypothetical protein [Rhizobacter sp. AJA081-3]QTN21507.1 hypothetical protein HZ992_15080 [Rhizobacter sp. AJA081-3]
MAINHELLSQIEASADEWGPSGKLGNDAEHIRVGKEDDKLEERLGLHPISIRFPKELVSDLKAIAHLQGMSYQPLIREVCKRFVEAEKRALRADLAQRRQKEAEEQRRLEQELAAARQAEQDAASQQALAEQEERRAA